MKNFDEIYKILSNISTEKIDNARKKFLTKTVITLIIAALFIIAGTYLLKGFIFFLIIIAVIISTILIRIYSSSISEIYKKEIITKLVSSYDENLQFDSTAHMEKIDYMLAEFERFDHFYSNDLIYGKIDGIIDFKLGDVRTEDVDHDSDGHKTRTTLFRGLFSVEKLNKDINTTIKIRLDKFFKLPNKSMLSMDSQEFEKYFDVYSTDKILAMRILTSDIMDYMLAFVKENKLKFEITIKKSQVYIRIPCPDMFELPILGKALDYEVLYKYYSYINFMCELNKKIYNVVSSKDI